MNATVAIGSHSYVVDLPKVIRRPLNSLRQLVDQGNQPGEQSFGNQGVWKRTQSDFVLGQGQPFFDQEDEANRRRYRAGRGFDPLSNRRTLTRTANWNNDHSFTASSTYKRLLRTPSNFWWAAGTTIGRSSSLTAVANTAVTGAPAAVTDMTYFDQYVYTAHGASGVYRGSATGTSVASWAGSIPTTVLNAESGRLLGGYNNELFEISSTPTKITVYTHPDTQFAWRCFATGTAGIYAAGATALKSEIHLVGVLDATGALAPPFPVAQLPAGELVNDMVFFGGFLVVCTTKGVRVAQTTQAGLIQYGPLLDFGNVRGAVFDGRFCYVGVDNLPTFNDPGVIALSLERFTAPLTPAYAAVHHGPAAAGVFHDITSADGRIVGLIDAGSNSNKVWFTGTTYSQTAEFWSGVITYGTPEAKVPSSIELTFDALPSGATLTISAYTQQGGTLLGSTTVSTAGETTATLTLTADAREGFELYLSASGTASGVSISRWTTRAIPAPATVTQEIIVPLIVSTKVLDDQGQEHHLDTLDEWEYLAGLQTARTPVTFTFGAVSEQVYVDQVGVDPDGWHTWNTERTWPDGTIYVRLLTV